MKSSTEILDACAHARRPDGPTGILRDWVCRICAEAAIAVAQDAALARYIEQSKNPLVRTCSYCGHESKGTDLAQMNALLLEHILACDKRPERKILDSMAATIAVAVAEEREACAQIVEHQTSGPMWRNLRKKVAGLIRDRGGKR